MKAQSVGGDHPSLDPKRPIDQSRHASRLQLLGGESSRLAARVPRIGARSRTTSSTARVGPDDKKGVTYREGTAGPRNYLHHYMCFARTGIMVLYISGRLNM